MQPPAAPHPTASSARGIAYGAAAGALWGLVFLAPELVPQFNGLHLAWSRYLAYGLISVVLLWPRRHTLKAHITGREWRALAGLSLLGNTLYYVLLATAVQTGGIAMTSLIIGFLPVAVTIIGSRDHGAVPLSKLAPSLLFCVAGAICIGGQALVRPSTAVPWLGLACAVGALASWTAYAVGNSRCLARLPQVSSDDWNLLTGCTTGLQALVLVPIALVLDHTVHSAHDWMRLAGVSAGVAVLASIGGNALWNRMSRLLPLTLAGQMILFETLFALLYGFVWEKRLPTLWETAAFVCVTLSVTSCIAAHKKAR